jgi:PilZ domain
MDEHLQPLPHDDSQRERERFHFSGTCQLTPIDDKGELLRNTTITIVGRDLSTTGISFSHKLPLSNKRAVITLNNADHPCALEVEVIWSKRGSTGLYETGCRLIRNLTRPG